MRTVSYCITQHSLQSSCLCHWIPALTLRAERWLHWPPAAQTWSVLRYRGFGGFCWCDLSNDWYTISIY